MGKWTPEQQAEHRRAWIKALRSGEYQQTTYCLKSSNNKFCCLGVACDLYLKSGEAPNYVKWDNNDNFVFARTNKKNPYRPTVTWNVLPDTVRDWLGLTSSCGNFDDKKSCGVKRALTTENDSGKTFKQIANIIEKEPEGLIKHD